MADIHLVLVIATAGIAIDQKVTATLGPHMAHGHGFKLPTLGGGMPVSLHHYPHFGNNPAVGRDCREVT
jgi:hypothetical protein